jgi:hypothetical protein
VEEFFVYIFVTPTTIITYTLKNVNIWNFFTNMFELERDLSSAYAERLALKLINLEGGNVRGGWISFFKISKCDVY